MPFIEPIPSQTVHPVKRRDMLPSIEVDMWGNLVQVDARVNHYDGVSRVERFANPLIMQPFQPLPAAHAFNSHPQHRQYGSQANVRLGWQDSPLPIPATSYPQDGYAYDQYGHLPMAFPVAAPYQGPGGWRAPVLEPRHILLSNHPSPHDTYRYPVSYASPVVEPPTKDQILQALAEWYVDQVIVMLVKPGSFRAGVGGSAEDVWGLGGREQAAWERVGRSAPDYSKPWGRMGMTATPIQPVRRPRPRAPEAEPHDPWNVLWCNTPTRSPSLVHFVKDVLARMSVEHTSVVAAVWFLGGLGLHEGDGAKGSELRGILRSLASTEVEAVEKRVAMLGLLLAGKWLDDNSFLSKSWTEVTAIPVVQIHQMEIAALQDLHWALYVPLPSWVDHVNKLFSAFVYTGDSREGIVYTALDDMVSQARQAELADPKASTLTLIDGSRRSSLDVAGDHLLSRDWGEFARSYTYEAQDVDADRELNRNVSALVDDEAMEDDEDEWGLDYDGAARWLPPMSELRRSLSGSRSPDGQAYYAQQSVNAYGDDGFHRSSSFGYGLATPGYQTAKVQNSSPMYYHQKPSQTYNTVSAAQRAYPTPPENPSYKAHRQMSSMELEPGVTVVRPPQEYAEYSNRRETRQEHQGLTPHEQQIREFDLNLDFPSAYGYYTRRSVRASH